MPSRTAIFVSAFLVNILAGLPLAMVAHGEPADAEGCLSAPWGDAPAGSHWRYHVDHVNKRNCWYLRRQGSEQSEALPQTQNSTAAPKSSTPPSPPAKPTISDARAELRPQSAREPANSPPANVAGNPANAAVNETGPANGPVWNATAAVATRWPDLSAAAAGSVPSAAPATTTAANDTPQLPADPAQAILPSIPFAHLSVPVRRETIWTLIAAIIGALACAGMAALFSRRGRTRRLRRRVAHSARGSVSETTDDDRIILSDHPYPDKADYRPRFGRSVGAAAASNGRKREFASSGARYARR
jgi:hypothetical protein